MGRRKKVIVSEEPVASPASEPKPARAIAPDEITLDEADGFEEDSEAGVPVNVPRLWTSITAEVEAFLKSCDNIWEVEWPRQDGNRISSPTRKIYVRAPKPWVKDDFQSCAEVAIHVDLRQSPPVQALLYIPQMILRTPNTVAHYSYILQDAHDLVKALSKIDVEDFRLPLALEDNIQLNYPKTNEEISAEDEGAHLAFHPEEETTQVSEQYVPNIDVADDFN
jgi:hypothetical protein